MPIMLHVLFKGLEEMNKSKDERATVGHVLMHDSEWKGRNPPPTPLRLWDWIEIEKASLGLERFLGK